LLAEYVWVGKIPVPVVYTPLGAPAVLANALIGEEPEEVVKKFTSWANRPTGAEYEAT
jgi:hypothetical protein